MGGTAELVAELVATLKHGLGRRDAETVVHSFEDELLVPRGLYLNGTLEHPGDGSAIAPRIVGLITRADGRDLSALEVQRVKSWLEANPAVTEVTTGPLKCSR